MKSEAQKKIFDLKADGGTNINSAILNATDLAQKISSNSTYDDIKQTMIIFLTDGEATSGITNSETIKSNIKNSNKGQVPIYGLAFGDGADFNLIKDISTESGAFTKRIYESGNSFEQLENYYKEISDPKLRNVTFQYIANGKLIPAKLVTGNKIQNAYGKNEYVITGELEDPGIKEIEIVTTGIDAKGSHTRRVTIEYHDTPSPIISNPPELLIPNPSEPSSTRLTMTSPKWEQSPAESFLGRLWAFKRIKFLLNDDVDCENGIQEEPQCFTWNDRLWEGIESPNPVETECGLESCIVCREKGCSEEAVNLAKKYNFVTKATSLVVESDDDYVKNGTINLNSKVPFDYYDYYDYGTSFASLKPHTAAGAQSSFFQTFSAAGAHSSDFSAGGGGTTTTTTTTTTPFTQCKLTLYSLTHFRGDFVEIYSDVSSLNSLQFDNKVGSLNIEGNCCWKIFVDDNLLGDFMQFRRQEYRSAVDIQGIYQAGSSVQILNKC